MWQFIGGGGIKDPESDLWETVQVTRGTEVTQRRKVACCVTLSIFAVGAMRYLLPKQADSHYCDNVSKKKS